MQTYRKYKNTISGLSTVMESVKSIEKVASSSLITLKKQLRNFQKFSIEITLMINRLSQYYKDSEHGLIRENNHGHSVLLLVSTDTGLVGSLNHNLVNFSIDHVKKYHRLVVLGRKIVPYLKEEQIHVMQTFSNALEISEIAKVQQINNYIFPDYYAQNVNKVDILYSQYISLVQQEPTIVPYLPFRFQEKKQTGEPINKKDLGFPIFEPGKKKIFAYLLKRLVDIYLHQTILEAKLSELSARTVEMEHAGAKAKELIDVLQHTFRKKRCQIRTKRQLEQFTIQKNL